MAVNRGKKFEEVVRKAFQKVDGVSIDRLADPMAGYAGVRNVCDFIVYKYPHQYYVECKSVHGNTLPFSNISDNQWKGLLEKSKINGVHAGILCWWVDKDVTAWLPIEELTVYREYSKSVKYCDPHPRSHIPGKKKRVFYEYDMNKFFEEMEKRK